MMNEKKIYRELLGVHQTAKAGMMA